MNKIILILVTIFTSTYCVSQAPYQIKSGKIDFVWNNGISGGTKTLIFDDSGRLEKLIGVEHIDTSLNLQKLGFPEGFKNYREIINSLYIQTKDSVFSIDLDSLVGYSRARIYFDIKSLFPADKKIGEIEFLGRVCNIMETPVGEMLMWKGICLNKFFKNEIDPIIYEYAISIDESYVIKTNEFKVPANIKMK